MPQQWRIAELIGDYIFRRKDAGVAIRRGQQDYIGLRLPIAGPRFRYVPPAICELSTDQAQPVGGQVIARPRANIRRVPLAR
jgi:hypothetical protein